MGTFFGFKKTQPLRALAMGVGSLANGTSDSHAPVPQGVPPVSKPFELIASKAVRPPRSPGPHARLETFLAEAERPQRYPFHPWKRIGRKRRDAITPTCTSLAVLFFGKGQRVP